MSNPITRRAAVISAAVSAAIALGTRRAAAVTNDDTYHPNDRAAAALGATTDGWINQTGPTWDDQTLPYAAREMENRDIIIQRHHRDGIDALFTTLAPPTTTRRILTAGDSITVGAGSTSPDGTFDQFYLGHGDGYRPWLASNLLRRRIHADYTIVAQGGQTLRTMTPPILAALPTAKPDIVLIDLGTNDIGGANDYTADWGTRYGQLLDGILTSSPTVRIACALLPLGSNPRTPDLNTTITNAVSQRRGTGRVTTADFTTLTTHWMGDVSVHPLEAGHVYMAAQWDAAIKEWTT